MIVVVLESVPVPRDAVKSVVTVNVIPTVRDLESWSVLVLDLDCTSCDKLDDSVSFSVIVRRTVWVFVAVKFALVEENRAESETRCTDSVAVSPSLEIVLVDVKVTVAEGVGVRKTSLVSVEVTNSVRLLVDDASSREYVPVSACVPVVVCETCKLIVRIVAVYSSVLLPGEWERLALASLVWESLLNVTDGDRAAPVAVGSRQVRVFFFVCEGRVRVVVTVACISLKEPVLLFSDDT